MIWSVSILSTGRTATVEVTVVSFCMLHNLPRVRDLAGDGGGGGGERACQHRPPAFALAALKIAVAGADGHLARGKLVSVHSDTHAAAGLAPLGTCRAED